MVTGQQHSQTQCSVLRKRQCMDLYYDNNHICQDGQLSAYQARLK